MTVSHRADPSAVEARMRPMQWVHGGALPSGATFADGLTGEDNAEGLRRIWATLSPGDMFLVMGTQPIKTDRPDLGSATPDDIRFLFLPSIIREFFSSTNGAAYGYLPGCYSTEGIDGLNYAAAALSHREIHDQPGAQEDIRVYMPAENLTQADLRLLREASGIISHSGDQDFRPLAFGAIRRKNGSVDSVHASVNQHVRNTDGLIVTHSRAVFFEEGPVKRHFERAVAAVMNSKGLVSPIPGHEAWSYFRQWGSSRHYDLTRP